MENVGKKCLWEISLKIGLLILYDFWVGWIKMCKFIILFEICKRMKLVIVVMLGCGWVALVRIRTQVLRDVD